MPRMMHSEDDFRDEVEDEAVEATNAEASRDGEAKQSMKKGPWTAAEDAILMEYVNKYGEGNWNSVQKNCGLTRCGKSCRLRWANHLRPNLKKGAFSQEEEQLIVELHAKLGNKWARMASLLPGRTDNEIKNFWNTRMKRRQRAGLPLYPPELQEEASLHHLHQNPQYHAPPPHHSSSFSFSSLLSSSSNKRHKLSRQLNNLGYDITYDRSNQHHQNIGLPLLSSVSPNGFSYSGGTMTEISSTRSETPPSSYSTGGVHGLMGGSTISPGLDYHEVAPLSSSTEGNSGLLDALLMESQALYDSAAGRKLSLKRKRIADEEDRDTEQLDSDGKDNSGGLQRDDLSSSQLSTEKKASSVRDNDPLEEMSSMDDDLFSLLNNFPSEMPVPEWYRRGERQALGVENQQEASLGQPNQQVAWTLGTCWSNDLHSIC
ncbi:transcription factor MYB101-like [Neltuma alba]|uniref:transcription factor MYB101-like n=1 Tax=Neltuma alba TaxID=207710 RepID=UPI0010A42498|nr:transcription factor MYB101-like [Prosopis alba]XP_028808372.1 transcription factor MYB101-like [Prosopis alba]